MNMYVAWILLGTQISGDAEAPKTMKYQKYA